MIWWFELIMNLEEQIKTFVDKRNPSKSTNAHTLTSLITQSIIVSFIFAISMIPKYTYAKA